MKRHRNHWFEGTEELNFKQSKTLKIHFSIRYLPYWDWFSLTNLDPHHNRPGVPSVLQLCHLTGVTPAGQVTEPQNNSLFETHAGLR